MRREKHIRTVSPYLAMIFALAMLMTSFSTPTMASADEITEEIAVVASTGDVEDAEAGTLEATVDDESEDVSSEDIEADSETEEEETEEEETEDVTETTWTVFIYLSGSNLESKGSYASQNIEALLEAPSNDQVRYVIQTGGATAWDNEAIEEDRCQRFVIRDGELKRVYDSPLKNMTDFGMLSDFIKWGTSNYPSEKKMLMLWDRSDAIGGIGTDEYYGDSLTVVDMINELKNSEETFDIIGLDAGLMADFDILSNLASYSDYVVSSQEYEPECGWDYEGFASYLAGNPQCNPKQFAKKICDTYIDNLSDKGNTSTATLCVVDTKALSDVKDAVDAMVSAISDKITDLNAFSTILSLGYNSKEYSAPYEKDLVCLADELAPVIGEDIAEKVRDAVEVAVVARAQYNEGAYNNGISFFWAPLVKNENYEMKLLDAYADYAVCDSYLRLIDAIFYEWHGSSELYAENERLAQLELNDYKVKYELKPAYGTVDSLVITDGIEIVNSIAYGINTDTDDGCIIQIAEKGNLNVTGGNSFVPAFDGKVSSIDGVPVMMRVVSETLDYTLYDVPVYFNNNGEDELCSLRISFTPEKEHKTTSNNTTETGEWVGDFGSDDAGEYFVLGIYSGGSSGSDYIAKDVDRLENGMQFAAAYPEKNDRGEVFYRKGDSFTYSNGTDVEMTPLSDGKYYITYIITTSLNQTITTPPQEVTINEGVLSKVDDAGSNAPAASEKEELIHIPCVSYAQYYPKKAPIVTPEGEVIKQEPEDNEPAVKKITVLTYLDGADLESEGISTGSIEAMINAKGSDDVNFILETGGCGCWKNDAIKNDAIQRFEVHEGTLVEVERLPKANFGCGYTLESFLKWGVEKYPAEKYIFITSDHGGAWRGNSQDYEYDYSIISIPEIAEALKNSGVHYDAVYFNCCLMADLEVAAAMAPYADYMIGSEEATIGEYGLDYDSEVYSYISRHANDFDGAKFGINAVNNVINVLDEYMTKTNFVSYQQLSVIDLKKIEGVTEAIDKYGVELAALKDDPQQLAQYLYSVDNARKYIYSYQKDIVNLMDNSEGISDDIRNEVINAVDEAVVYSQAINDNTRTCGLSIFFPDDSVTKTALTDYTKVCPCKNYLAFIDSISLSWHAPYKTYLGDEDYESVNVLDYQIDSEVINIDDKTTGIKINDGITNALYYSIYEKDPDGYRLHDITRMGTIYPNDDYDAFIPRFDGRVITIDGIQCCSYVYDEQEDSIVYAVPVKIKDVYANLLIEVRIADGYDQPELIGDFDIDGADFEILGALISNNPTTGVPKRDVIILDENMEITFVKYQSDNNGNHIYARDGETITYCDDTKVTVSNLPDGEYVLVYEITNGLMKKERSVPVDILIRNGRIQEEVPRVEEIDDYEDEICDVDEDYYDDDDDDDDDDEIDIDIDDLQYYSEEEDASEVFFIAGAEYEDAAILAENLDVVKFKADDSLGFFGSVAAYCVDYEKYAQDTENMEEPDDEENTEAVEDTDANAEEGKIYVNYIDDVGILASDDPVALDQACLDILSQLEDGGEILYKVMDCHGIELLEAAAEGGCGNRYYKLEFVDRNAE